MPVSPMRAVSLILPFVVAACGGGGRQTIAPLMPTVQITSANAVEVARVALSASLGLADVAGIGVGVLTAVPPEPTAPLSLQAQALRSLGELVGAGSTLAARVSASIPGAEGGEAFRFFDDRDDDERVTTGDALTITFVAFAEDGLVLNGTLVFDDLVVEGDLVDGLSWIVQTRLDFLNLAITVGEVTETLDGAVRCRREKRATVMTLEMEVEAGFTVAGTVLEAGTKLAYHEYVLDFTFAQFAQGAVEDEAIGGRVLFLTKVPFTGIQFLPDPSSGMLEVLGAGGSMLTITAIDFFNVEIAVDADGDGEAEETLSMEWSAL